MSEERQAQLDSIIATSRERLAADDSSPLLKFACELSIPYTVCIKEFDRLREHGVGLADNPLGEVYHVFAGGNLDATQWEEMAATVGDKHAIKKMILFADQGGLPIMRIKNWEKKVDFDSMSWQGQKPSEVLEAAIERINEFKQQNAALFEEVQKGGGRGEKK